jgi:hypothetical protein
MASTNAQPLPDFDASSVAGATASIQNGPQTELEVFVPAQAIRVRQVQVHVTSRCKAQPHPRGPRKIAVPDEATQYPWYRLVEGSALEQGDLLRNFDVLTPQSEFVAGVDSYSSGHFERSPEAATLRLRVADDCIKPLSRTASRCLTAYDFLSCRPAG